MARIIGQWFMSNILTGTTQADEITGMGFADTLRGGGDKDMIDGGGGDDKLYGDAGDDLLLGGKGNDTLYGGADQDVLDGGIGDDELRGDGGNDVFTDIRGDNDIFGGIGLDTVDYSAFTGGRVTVDLGTGAADRENIVYQSFNDGRPRQISTIEVVGSDTLSSIEAVVGGIGDDILKGDDYANTISGGGGDDRIVGRGGADVMTGGAGRDTFQFDDGDSNVRITDLRGQVTVDRITDFRFEDRIDLSRIDANTSLNGDQRFFFADNFTGSAGELLVRQDDAHNFRLIGDTNGDGAGDVFIDFHEVTGNFSVGNVRFYSDATPDLSSNFVAFFL